MNLDELRSISAKIHKCDKCHIGKLRRNACPGNIKGNEPNLMIIGEAPGQEEDRIGKVFVGRAGKLLRKAIAEIGLDNFFITNIIKCRPPSNRDPSNEEIQNCLPYLFEQIDVIGPRVIICLGKVAYENLYDHLKVMPIKVFNLWHPAYVLRKMSIYPTWILQFKKIKEEIKNESNQ